MEERLFSDTRELTRGSSIQTFFVNLMNG